MNFIKQFLIVTCIVSSHTLFTCDPSQGTENLLHITGGNITEFPTTITVVETPILSIPNDHYTGKSMDHQLVPEQWLYCISQTYDRTIFTAEELQTFFAALKIRERNSLVGKLASKIQYKTARRLIEISRTSKTNSK
jgi:hypothetical protein